MPPRPTRRRAGRPAARDPHRIGRLEARLAVETDARRALADRVEAVELRLEAIEHRTGDLPDLARRAVDQAAAEHQARGDRVRALRRGT